MEQLNTKNLYILLVLYKKDIKKSKAYQTLQQLLKAYTSNNFKINFIIWNNSPEFNFEKDNFEYYEGENSTLSIIYNSMAKKYLKSENDFLMISDDDTDYTNFDFEKLFDITTTNKNKTGIFVPQLHVNDILVSPGKRFLFKGKYIQSIDDGLIKSKNILGMNSGLIITYQCIKKMPFLFDERLNFYGTDTDFFIRYENYFDFLYVLPLKIQHDLSEKKELTKQAFLFQFHDKNYSLRVIFKDSLFIELLIFYRFLVASLSLKKFFFFLKYFKRFS